MFAAGELPYSDLVSSRIAIHIATPELFRGYRGYPSAPQVPFFGAVGRPGGEAAALHSQLAQRSQAQALLEAQIAEAEAEAPGGQWVFLVLSGCHLLNLVAPSHPVP